MASLALGAACSSVDGDPQATSGSRKPATADPGVASAAVSAMVGSLSPGEQPLGTYFSFERFADGSGVTLEGSTEEVLTEIFGEGSVDPTVGQPFQEALVLGRPDQVVIDVSSVAATYMRVDAMTLMVGDFDAEAIVERTEAIIDRAGEADTMTVTSDEDGDFRVLSLLDAEPANGDGEGEAGDDERSPARMIPGLWPSGSLAVSHDRLLVLSDGVNPAELIVDSADESPLETEGAREVTAALDDAQVYAALINLSAVTPEGGEGALAGGFGTGFVDGDQHAYTVLAHADEATATSNATAVSTIMADDADCSGDVDVQVDGGLLVASCPVEESDWAGYVSSRVGLGPFSF